MSEPKRPGPPTTKAAQTAPSGPRRAVPLDKDSSPILGGPDDNGPTTIHPSAFAVGAAAPPALFDLTAARAPRDGQSPDEALLGADVVRTDISQAAFAMSTQFNNQFSHLRLGGRWVRTVKLAAPGESTGGGARARQSISLVASAEAAPRFVVGFLDVTTRAAELRTHAAMTAVQAGRGADFDVRAQDHAALLTQLSSWLTNAGFTVRTVDRVDSPEAISAPRPAVVARKPSVARERGLVALVALGVVGAGVLAGWLLAR